MQINRLILSWGELIIIQAVSGITSPYFRRLHLALGEASQGELKITSQVVNKTYLEEEEEIYKEGTLDCSQGIIYQEEIKEVCWVDRVFQGEIACQGVAWPRILPFSEAYKTIKINPVFSGSHRLELIPLLARMK